MERTPAGHKAPTACRSLNDGALGSVIVVAFLNGLAASDIAFVHSHTALEWVDAAAEYHRIKLPRTLVVPPPADPSFVCEAAPPRGERTSGPIVYNHRLYSHYGTDLFIKLGRRLVRELGYEIVVTDVLGERDGVRGRLDQAPSRFRAEIVAEPGFTLVDGVNRDLYKAVLTDAFLVVAAQRPGCTWSMSCVDAQGMGVPVVAPRLNWYEEHFHPSALYRDEHAAVTLVSNLERDCALYHQLREHGRASAKGLNPDTLARRFAAGLAD